MPKPIDYYREELDRTIKQNQINSINNSLEKIKFDLKILSVEPLKPNAGEEPRTAVTFDYARETISDPIEHLTVGDLSKFVISSYESGDGSEGKLTVVVESKNITAYLKGLSDKINTLEENTTEKSKEEVQNTSLKT